MDKDEILDATIVEDEAKTYEDGLRDMKLAVMNALDDGSECSLWALDVVGSL